MGSLQSAIISNNVQVAISNVGIYLGYIGNVILEIKIMWRA